MSFPVPVLSTHHAKMIFQRKYYQEVKLAYIVITQHLFLATEMWPLVFNKG